MIGSAFRRLGFCKQKYGSSFQYKVCKWVGLDFNAYDAQTQDKSIANTLANKKTKSPQKNTISWDYHRTRLKLAAQTNMDKSTYLREQYLDIDLKMFEYSIKKVEDETKFIEFQTSFCDVGFAHMGLGSEDYEHKKEDEIFLHLERPDRFSSSKETVPKSKEKKLLLHSTCFKSRGLLIQEDIDSFNYAAFSYPKINDIKIQRPFEISTTTITRELFFEIMSNDSKFKNDLEKVRNIKFDRLKNFLDFHIVNDKCKEPMYPISVNDWYLAIDFCNALSRRCNLKPAYTKVPEQHLKCNVVLNKEGRKIAQIEKPIVYLKNKDIMNLSRTIEDIEQSLRMKTKLKNDKKELKELKDEIGSRSPTFDEISDMNHLQNEIDNYDLFEKDRKKTIEILQRFMEQEAYVRDDFGHIQYRINPINDANGFRLPMEVEWVYAAQANTNTRYSGSNKPNDVSWFGQFHQYPPNEKHIGVYTKKDEFFQDFYPSKLKMPNAWGIYDMSGNLWEWTQDFFNPLLLQEVSDLKDSKMKITSDIFRKKTTNDVLTKPTYDLAGDYNRREIMDKSVRIVPLNNENYNDQLSTMNGKNFGLDVDQKTSKKLNVNEITIKGGGNSGLTSSFAKSGLIGYRQRALKVNMYIPEVFEQFKEYILALYYYGKQIWKAEKIKSNSDDDVFFIKTNVPNLGFINEAEDLMDREYREAFLFDDINFSTPLFVMIIDAFERTSQYFRLYENGQLIEDLVMDGFSMDAAERKDAYERINIDNVAPLPTNVTLTHTLHQDTSKIIPNVENMHIGIRLVRYLD